MPYWMEVHCAKKIASNCNSNVLVDMPMTLTYNVSMKAIVRACAKLSKEAKELGWIQKDSDWICPKCKGI